MKPWNITPTNLPAHEWLGLLCTVTDSTDKSKIGQTGMIINETKNTLVLQTQKGEKMVPKKEARVTFEWNGQQKELDVSKWCVSPENRIKTFFKNKKR